MRETINERVSQRRQLAPFREILLNKTFVKVQSHVSSVVYLSAAAEAVVECIGVIHVNNSGGNVAAQRRRFEPELVCTGQSFV